VQNLIFEVIHPILSIINSNFENNNTTLQELKLRSLFALENIVSHPEAATIVLDPSFSDSIRLLIDMAIKSPLQISQKLERNFLDLSKEFFDSLTKPKKFSVGSSPMATVLPYYPLSDKVDLLPTCFDTKRHLGLIFWGSDLRTVENSGFSGISLRSRSSLLGSGERRRHGESQKEELLVVGNVSIPVEQHFYFEVKIKKADQNSIISIGLSLEGASSWGDNSYHFQANKIKTWYVNGTKKEENYGESFQCECTVGCGWNPETKSIYFSRNEVDMGNAFDNVNFEGMKIVPVVGIGKGVQVKINFGQEPFLYNYSTNEVVNEEEKN